LIKLTFIFVTTISVVFSQDTLIVFDRPGVADSPYITDKGNWQLETGLAYSEVGGISEAILPSFMVRKSFLGANELRLAFNYEPQMMGIIKRHMALDQDPIALGIKRKLWKERGSLPEASLLANTFFPMQLLNKISKSNTYNVELGLQFQNNLNDHFALNYNIGTIVTNCYNKGILNYSLCLNITATDKLGFFIESFGYSPLEHKPTEFGFDFGCVFNPTDKSQIDISFIDNIYSSTHYGSLLIGYSIILSK
jgi:hypothetical protein